MLGAVGITANLRRFVDHKERNARFMARAAVRLNLEMRRGVIWHKNGADVRLELEDVV